MKLGLQRTAANKERLEGMWKVAVKVIFLSKPLVSLLVRVQFFFSFFKAFVQMPNLYAEPSTQIDGTKCPLCKVCLPLAHVLFQHWHNQNN